MLKSMTIEELGWRLDAARREYVKAKDDAEPLIDAMRAAEDKLETLRAEYKEALRSQNND
jgi:hypothetical protein